MSNNSSFRSLYSYKLEQNENLYILNNPSIKNSLLLFFKNFDLQYFLDIQDVQIEQIFYNYFEHLDKKQKLIDNFIVTFSQEEIQKTKEFISSPNLIGFTDLGYLHNLLLWYLYYKNKGLGNIDNFIQELNSIQNYDQLENRFYNLSFVDNPELNSNSSNSKLKITKLANQNLSVLFYNLINQIEPNNIVLSKEDYYNLVFLFNVLESKITLINYYNDNMLHLSYRPFFKVFESIIYKVKSKT